MTRLSLKGLMAHKLRAALTALAIILGTAMISGTFVITNQIDRAFANIFNDAYKNTDVFVDKKPAFGGDLGPTPPLPESIVDKVRAVDGVAKAIGQVQGSGSLVVNGKVLHPVGGAPSLVISSTGPPFATDKFVEGHRPQASGQVAVITQFARDHNLHVGQQVELTTLQGTVPVTISGIFDYGAASSLGGTTLVVTTLADAQRWYDQVGKVSDVAVAADPGVSPSELAGRLRAQLPDYARVRTGTQTAKAQTDAISGAINGFLGGVLLAFGGIAVFVGAFIIFNTFSITVAQRMREFAMLRTVGATRRQVLRAILGEAVAIGVIGSFLGFLGGIGLAELLNWVFGKLGFGLPLSSIQLTTGAVLAPFIVGIGITVLASLVPALRATRVPPVAALREGATLPPSRFAPAVPYVSVALPALGIAVILYGVFGSGTTITHLLLLAVGLLILLVGVAMGSRYLVPVISRIVAWPLIRLSRGPARLARDNATRNPGRTAVTAAALMVGVTLVVAVAVLAHGFQETFIGAIDRSVTSNLVITNSSQQQPVPSEVVNAATNVSGVADATGIGVAQTQIGHGGTDSMNGVDPGSIASVYRFDWQKGGSDALLGELGPGKALVEQQFAKSHHLSPGDTFQVTGVNGRHMTLHEIGQYKDPVLFAGYVVATGTFNKLTVSPQPAVVLVRFTPGAPEDSTKAGVQQALGNFPDIKVQTVQEYKDSVSAQINGLLYFIYALLAFSVVISLFGIVNTLVLSVFERTREIGMLRAVGTTRRQIRRMVRYESVITAVIGGILGAVLGIVVAWIVTLGLSDQGIVFSVPTAQVIIAVIVAAITGVLAAVFPARRASRLNVLEALQYE
ncbi:MAG: ABC transporter permease [Gaiellales bacterium]